MPSGNPIRRHLSQIPTLVLAVVLGLVLFVAVAYAATRPSNGRQTPEQLGNAEQVAPSPTPTSTPSDVPTPGPAPELPDLVAELERIQDEQGVTLGLSIVPISPVGAPLLEPYVWGSDGGNAWSTLDVVIALAVIRNAKQPEDVDYLLNRAISQSSPAGDEALWAYLGDASTAAAKTTTKLRIFGDLETEVATSSSTHPAAPFNDTNWSNTGQALSIASMYCLDDTWPILSRLNQPANPWGLETLARTPVKSGGGQLSNGSMEVRQLGLVLLADGNRIGVGLSAVADDGTAATAQNAITELAPFLYQVTGFAGHC